MHYRLISWICFLTLLVVGVGRLYAQGPAANRTVFVPLIIKLGGPPSGGAIHTGEATYYNEADGGGNCSFDPTPQDLMVGAMNHTDYAEFSDLWRLCRADGPEWNDHHSNCGSVP